nr:zinc knuckle CX2CX4HX4C [Tanacetum cinerariifolium]
MEMEGNEGVRVSIKEKLDDAEVRDEGVFGNKDCGNKNDVNQDREKCDDAGIEIGLFGNTDYCNSMDKTPNVSVHVSNNDDNDDLVYVHTVESSDETTVNEDEVIVNNNENVDTGAQCKNNCNLEHTNIDSQTKKAMKGDETKTASYELNYHLCRMWGKYGLRKITSIGNGNFVFKFNNESGLQTVIENGVWIVNNKPMVVQKWDIDVEINKVEPDKLPIWVKLVNLPLEAWTTKGLSALASMLGKPVM